MISKEKFMDIIRHQIAVDKLVNVLGEVHFDIIDTPLFDGYGYFLDCTLEAYFIDEGVEHINWFLFEHHDMGEDFNSDLTMVNPGRLNMWDENGQVIPMNTIDDLWNYVKDLRK